MTSLSDGLSDGRTTVGLVSKAPVTVGAGPSPMSNEGDGVADVDAPVEAEPDVEAAAEPDVDGLAPPPLEDPPHAVRTRAAGITATSSGRRRADGRWRTGTLRWWPSGETTRGAWSASTVTAPRCTAHSTART